jgi:hypothetical protein
MTGWPDYPGTPTNQLRIPGETLSMTNTYFAYTDYGTPTAQWPKNGSPVIGATNFEAVYGGALAGYFQGVLTITNVQPADAGIYDVVVLGNNWIVGPKTILSIPMANGQGFLSSPRIDGSNFISDLVGAQSRNYAIEWSTKLYSWSNLLTLSKSTGTVTFSNSIDTASSKFFRPRLLP